MSAEQHPPTDSARFFLPETPLAGVQRPVGDLPPVPDDPEAAKRQVGEILAEEVRSIRDAIRLTEHLEDGAQEAHIAAFVERIDALIDDGLAESPRWRSSRPTGCSTSSPVSASRPASR
jgi:hypothetical protein